MKQWKLAQDQFAKPITEPSLDKMFDKLSVMQQLFRQPFGPEEELEADRDGVTWAYHLGYDPRTVQQVYVAMEQAGLGAPAFLPAFLRSHPLTSDRAEKLRAAYAALQTAEPKARLYLGRENLKRRITRQQKEFATSL
jgi:predicted Zn-dependent protease